MEVARGFEELEVWKAAMNLAELVHRQVLPQLPDHERYVMERQLRRSIQSVPANIAEAHGRHHYQDASRFCYIARGSWQVPFRGLRCPQSLVANHKSLITCLD
jgi:hypothetical protein